MQINIMSFLSLITNNTAVRVKVMTGNVFSAETVAQLEDKIAKEGFGDAMVYRVQPLFRAQELYVECYIC